MTRPCDIEHVEIVRLDQTIKVHIDEVLPWRCSPMANHQGFDMRKRERLLQKRIVTKIDLPHRDVVRRPPIGVDALRI